MSKKLANGQVKNVGGLSMTVFTSEEAYWAAMPVAKVEAYLAEIAGKVAKYELKLAQAPANRRTMWAELVDRFTKDHAKVLAFLEARK